MDEAQHRAHDSEAGGVASHCLPDLGGLVVAVLHLLDLLVEERDELILVGSVHNHLQAVPGEVVLDAREAVLKGEETLLPGGRGHLINEVELRLQII